MRLEELPTKEEVTEKIHKGTSDSLDLFIFTFEPPSQPTAILFRQQLLDIINDDYSFRNNDKEEIDYDEEVKNMKSDLGYDLQ